MLGAVLARATGLRPEPMNLATWHGGHDRPVGRITEAKDYPRSCIKSPDNMAALPKRVCAYPCADKLSRQSWADPGRAGDLANFPSPFRAVLLGPPNVGKSTLALNLVVHQNPPFDEVFVVHEDAGHTREYDELQPTDIFPEIPSLEYFNRLPTMMDDEETGEERPVRRCIIVDDLEYTSARKQRLKDLAVLVRFVSSHKNMSVIVGHQSAFDVPELVRKCADLFVIWRPKARLEMSNIENRVGVPHGLLSGIFDRLGRDARDSITIDWTRGTPAPLRWNIWTPLNDLGDVQGPPSDRSATRRRGVSKPRPSPE